MTDIPAPKDPRCNFCGNPHPVMKHPKVGGMKRLIGICGPCVTVFADEIAIAADQYDAEHLRAGD